jgi:hypothetical protein
MKRHTLIITVALVCSLAYICPAKVDLVTLPARDTVQLTIYNSADLTLARESRALTLKEGENKLQFSWENTLIDPTSLDMLPKANADKIDITELTYPPRVKNLGLWSINSEVSGKVPVEISYLTSGLSWRAFYMGTLAQDEKTMHLQGYVRVTNNSGEDYENAQTRLIVGKVNLLDRIADLARRAHPYGRPDSPRIMYRLGRNAGRAGVKSEMMEMSMMDMEAVAPKKIAKEGLSEYFLYTIEGTETIRNGWSKRLASFDTEDVPVVNLYKHQHDRYGDQVLRFLSFKNDEKHKLGDTPIPGGNLKVYRNAGDNGHLSYTGQSSFKYIPVDEDVELNLGAVTDIVVEATLMDQKTKNYSYNYRGDIDGFDETKTFEVKVKNTRDIPAKVEITRNNASTSWDIKKGGQFDKYEKIDASRIKFTVELRPRSEKTFTYTITTHNGTRAERR